MTPCPVGEGGDGFPAAEGSRAASGNWLVGWGYILPSPKSSRAPGQLTWLRADLNPGLLGHCGTLGLENKFHEISERASREASVNRGHFTAFLKNTPVVLQGVRIPQQRLLHPLLRRPCSGEEPSLSRWPGPQPPESLALAGRGIEGWRSPRLAVAPPLRMRSCQVHLQTSSSSFCLLR